MQVLGAVARPGELPFEPGMTAVQAIALAGGFTLRADIDGRGVQFIRCGHRYRLDIRAVGKSEDVQLEPGDVVFTKER